MKEVEDRLDTINHLKLKYGRTIEEILKYRDEKQNYLENLKNYDDEKEKIKEQSARLENGMQQVCEELSVKRRKAALILEELVIKALTDLNFLSVSFKIDIQKKENFSENGYDHVEFMISTNPGEPLKPLAKVARR